MVVDEEEEEELGVHLWPRVDWAIWVIRGSLVDWAIWVIRGSFVDRVIWVVRSLGHSGS